MADPKAHLHIVPVDDIIEHVVDVDEECICGPRMDLVEGQADWLWVHNSLDGREFEEADG
jgi:hypothetical protein